MRPAVSSTIGAQYTKALLSIFLIIRAKLTQQKLVDQSPLCSAFSCGAERFLLRIFGPPQPAILRASLAHRIVAINSIGNMKGVLSQPVALPSRGIGLVRGFLRRDESRGDP